jgi:predicted negative regulator of RcsB-dependent stress response
MDWINTTAVIIAFLLSAFNLWDRVDARKKAAQEPTKKLEIRVEALEDIIKNEYENRFKSDLRRIEILEEGNRVTQKALLALLAHARDGNNTKQLEDAENDLKEYLINR